MMQPVLKTLALVWLLSLPLIATAQTDAARRQQAVTLLVKETAQRVFAELSEGKNAKLAKHTADSLSRCPASCDPFAVIDKIDSTKKWAKVRDKMTELQRQAAQYQQKNSPDSVLAVNLAVRLQNFADTSGSKNDVYKKALTKENQKAIMMAVNKLLILEKFKGSGDPPPKKSLGESPNSLPLLPLTIGLLAGLGLGAAGSYLLLRRKPGTASPPKPAPKNSEEVTQPLQNQANQTSSLSRDVEGNARRYENLIKNTGYTDPLLLFQTLKRITNGANGENLINIIQLLRDLAKADDTTNLIAFLRAHIARQPTSINPPAPVPSSPPIGETLPLMITPQSQQPVAAPVMEQSVADVVSGNVFYLPPPSEAGTFDAAQASPMPTTTTAYRFMPLAKKPSEARFRFEAEPNRVERFLTYRHYMIKPACDSTDELLPGQTRVQNVTDGTATLENGQWSVTKKALISYQ